MKVKARPEERNTVLKTAQRYGSRVLDIGEETMTIEITGQTEEVDRFVGRMERFGIVEMARTGIACTRARRRNHPRLNTAGRGKQDGTDNQTGGNS